MLSDFCEKSFCRYLPFRICISNFENTLSVRSRMVFRTKYRFVLLCSFARINLKLKSWSGGNSIVDEDDFLIFQFFAHETKSIIVVEYLRTVYLLSVYLHNLITKPLWRWTWPLIATPYFDLFFLPLINEVKRTSLPWLLIWFIVRSV